MLIGAPGGAVPNAGLRVSGVTRGGPLTPCMTHPQHDSSPHDSSLFRSVASPVVTGAVTLLASVIRRSMRPLLLNPASMKQALVESVRLAASRSRWAFSFLCRSQWTPSYAKHS